MAMVLEAEANLTAQNQITVPATIRKALKLQGGKSRIKFRVFPEKGQVVILRAEPKSKSREDPALEPFLSLLQEDLRLNPGRIVPFPARLLEKANSLVEGVEIDLDGPLTGED